MNTAVPTLPPLEHFTRDELVRLVGILHGGLVRAQADYETLSRLTARSNSIAECAMLDLLDAREA